MSILTYALQVFRYFNTNNVPSSGDHEPVKSEIQALFGLIDSSYNDLAIAVSAAGGNVIVVPTLNNVSDLSLSYPSGTLAFAMSGTAAGIYLKSGGSGSGSWTLTNISLTSQLITALQSAIMAETSARIAADNALQDAIDDLKDDIEAEGQNREDSETAILVQSPNMPHAGDAPLYFTNNIQGDDPASHERQLPGSLVVNPEGYAVRIIGSGILSVRTMYPIEAGRTYRVRYAVRRNANSADPANDSVRLGLAWYGQSRSPVSGTPTTVVDDLNSLTTASGRVEVSAYVSLAAGDNIDIVAPSSARYVRPFAQTFGTLPQTDIEVISWTDVTDAVIYSPDVSDLVSRVGSLEAIDAGGRLDIIEAELNAPGVLGFRLRADAQAYDVPVSVTAIVITGNEDIGDGEGGLFKRVGGAGSGDRIQTADGSWWLNTEYEISIPYGSLHKWYPKHVFPQRPSQYATILSTYGYSYVYPQAFFIDEVANEIWMSYLSNGGSNSWAWIVVRDRDTLAQKACFSAGGNDPEGLVIAYDGSTRYLYIRASTDTLGRYDVTSLPADLSRLTGDTYTISMRNTLGYQNGRWYVETVTRGAGSFKHAFTIWDENFDTPKGTLRFSLFSQGSTSGYGTDGTLNKRQGFAAGNDMFLGGFGGIYRIDGSPTTPSRYTDQGFKIFNAAGQILAQSMVNADQLLPIVQTIVPTAQRVENEGAYISGDGGFYTMTCTSPSDMDSDSVIIWEHFSSHRDAIDVSGILAPQIAELDGDLFYPIRQGIPSGSMHNPLTGATFTTLAEITDYMALTNTRETVFYTTSFPGIINPATGVALPTGSMVRITNRNNLTFDVLVTNSSLSVTYLNSSGTWTTGSAPILNPYANMTWLALGDSITADASGYAGRASQRLGLALTNAGVSSSRMAEVSGSPLNPDAFCNKTAGGFTTGYSVITVAFGTNDASATVPIGTIGSTDKEEFYGAMNVGYSNIMNDNPSARVIFIMPTYRTSGVGEAGLANYRTAIKAFCAAKNIPLILTNEEMGINADNSTTFLSDGLHFNTTGRTLYGNYAAAKISSLI